MLASWSPAPPDVSVPSDAAVHVWGASLEPGAAVQRAYRDLLSSEERERADRFVFDADRIHFVVAHGWMRTRLAQYLDRDPAALAFKTGEHGKPALASDPALAFNLSHSGTCVLLAVAAPGRLVGVDVEAHRALDDAMEIADRFFSPDDVRRFRALSEDARTEGFFNAWTRKEAFVKAVGTGLTLPLSDFDVSLAPGSDAELLALRAEAWQDRSWSLRDLAPGSGYSAALCLDVPAPSVSLFRDAHAE